MKRKDKHIFLLLLAGWLGFMFSACSNEGDEPQVLSTKKVEVNMSRSEGNANDYVLMFWKTDPTLIINPVFHSIPAGNVNDFVWKATGASPYKVTYNGGEDYTYPTDNTPVYAVGYAPQSQLDLGHDNYKTLSLNSTAVPGLVDVCTTDREQGNESSPFTLSEDNQLEFRHTLVQLNFQTRRTENVNGRIADVSVTIDNAHFTDTWKFADSTGYQPVAPVSTTIQDLAFTSAKEWFQDTDFHPLSYMKDGTKYGNVYVRHNTGLFSYDGTNAYITIPVDAVVIVNGREDPLVFDLTLTIPLTDMDGNPWTDEVEPGDSFTISIIFDQNSMNIWAQKTPWNQGGILSVPLRPYFDKQ